MVTGPPGTVPGFCALTVPAASQVGSTLAGMQRRQEQGSAEGVLSQAEAWLAAQQGQQQQQRGASPTPSSAASQAGFPAPEGASQQGGSLDPARQRALEMILRVGALAEPVVSHTEACTSPSWDPLIGSGTAFISTRAAAMLVWACYPMGSHVSWCFL